MLQSSALIVKLNISQFGLRKKDKKVTEEVNNQYYAAKDAGSYNKALLKPDAREITAIKEIVSAARAYHVDHTLPWHDGARLLPVNIAMEYRDQMENKYKQQFVDAVEDFMSRYDDLKTQAMSELGSMYNEKDYPPREKVEASFGFKVTIEPIAGVDSFWQDLQDDEIAQIKADYEKSLVDKEAAAMGDLWNRLYDTVSKMAEALSDDDKIFRDTLVGNISDLVDLLPKLNIGKDPNLDAMREEVAAKLLSYSPKELRKDKLARKATAKSAREICDAMAGYMGGPPAIEIDTEEAA